MDFHLDNLLELGMKQFCLHAGDFLYKESSYLKNQIVDFGRCIREKVPHLMIYGVGSKHYFQRFHHADTYVTSSHFMQAFNHMVISGATWTNFKGKPTKEVVMKNFDYLRRQVEGQSDQRDLTEWMPAMRANESIVENTALDHRIINILEG